MAKIALIVLLIPLVSGNPLSNLPNLNTRLPGPCPALSPVPNYDVNKILGSWVTVTSSDRNLISSNCMNSTVKKTEKGLTLDCTVFTAIPGLILPVDLDLTEDKANSGVYTTPYENFGEKGTSYQTGTFEGDFLLLWNCIDLGKEHIEDAFVQCKDGKTPPEETLNKFYDFLSTRGSSIKREEFFTLPDVTCGGNK